MSENNPTHMVKAMQAGGYEMIPIQRGLASLSIALSSDYGRLVIGLNSGKDKIKRYLKECSISFQF